MQTRMNESEPGLRTTRFHNIADLGCAVQNAYFIFMGFAGMCGKCHISRL